MGHRLGGAVRDPAEGTLDVVSEGIDVGALYATYRAGLVRLAAMLVDDVATAEDVVQEVFLRLQRGRDRVAARDGAIVGYLRTAVVNEARSALRRRRTATRHLRSAEPDSGPGADAALLLNEEHRAVVRVVQQLPPSQREVVVLRYWMQLSEAEIAETLGISKGTVKSQASRAMDKIESMLGGEPR
jgi:RNA polymerase sigma-70 factor (sigma-E family)